MKIATVYSEWHIDDYQELNTDDDVGNDLTNNVLDSLGITTDNLIDIKFSTSRCKFPSNKNENSYVTVVSVLVIYKDTQI